MSEDKMILKTDIVVTNNKAASDKAYGEIKKADKDSAEYRKLLRAEELNQQAKSDNQKIAQAKKTNKQIVLDEKTTRDLELAYMKASIQKKYAAIDEMNAKIKAATKERVAYQKKLGAKWVANGKQNFAYYAKLEKERTAQVKAEESKRARTRNLFSKQRLASIFSTISAYAGIGTAIYGTIAAIKDTVTEYLKLDKVMNQVKAITNATKEEVKALGTSVRVTAASIGKSISDVSAYAVAMSKLGLSVKEITSVTESVATLSAVLGEGLAETGTLVVTTLKQFNLEIEDASYVTSVFFKAIKESPLDMNKLATAMQYVGSSAEAVGVNFKQAGDMMILLANRGLKASKIGTGLRNVFVKLKEDGNDVIEVLRDMNTAGLQFSEAVDLFGKRGAIVGYNLIANFQELEKMFKESLPTAMDNIVAKTQATSGTLDWLNRTWQRTKSLFTDWNALAKQTDDKYVRNLISYVDELENAEQVFDKLNEYAKGGNKSGFVDIIEESIPKGITYSGNLKRATKKLYDELFKIYELQGLVRKGRETGKELVTGGEGVSLYAGIDLSPESIEQQNKSVTQIEALIKRVKKQRITPTYLKSEEFIDTTDSEFKSIISYLEKQLLKVQQLNVTSYDEMLDFIRSNGELAKNEARARADALGSSQEKLASELDGIDATLDKYKKILCKNHPWHPFCKEDKKQQRTYDKDDSVDISMGAAYDKTKVDFGDLFKYGELTDYDSTLRGITDYYDILTNQINEEESEALAKIEKNRDGIREEYLYKKDQLAKEMSGATGATLVGLEKKDLKLDIDYSGQRESLDKQQIEVVKNTNDVKLKLEKKYNKDLDALNKAVQKKNEADNKSAYEKKQKQWSDELKAEEAFRKSMLDIASKSISALTDIYSKFQQENLDNKLNAISSELEASEARSDVQSDILQSQLDNNIITAEAYEKKRVELEKKVIDEKNRLNEAAFEAQKKADINAAIVNGIAGAAQAFVQALASQPPPYSYGLAAISAGLVSAKANAEVVAISRRKFFPVQYAEGGEVVGASHKDGGVPFTVNGQGGYEMEGGEFIMDKQATSKYKPMLEAMLTKNRPHNNDRFFANGGNIPESVNSSQNRDTVVRAYITKRDLRKYSAGESRLNKISKV